MKQVAFDFQFPVRADETVTLSVRIGDGQVGGSVARVDDADPPICPPGNITNVEVGRGAALIGHTLVVRTLVADVNPQTNRTTVTLDLNGGAPGRELQTSAEVDAEGDAVFYTSTVAFTPLPGGVA
jgi:hypothetical protein